MNKSNKNFVVYVDNCVQKIKFMKSEKSILNFIRKFSKKSSEDPYGCWVDFYVLKAVKVVEIDRPFLIKGE